MWRFESLIIWCDFRGATNNETFSKGLFDEGINLMMILFDVNIC